MLFDSFFLLSGYVIVTSLGKAFAFLVMTDILNPCLTGAEFLRIAFPNRFVEIW